MTTTPLTGRVYDGTPTAVSQTLPDADPVEIIRDNLLDGLETQLVANRILLIDGPPGAGKTTLLSQFCRRHAGRTLSLFVSAASRFSFHPDQVVYDLCNQLSVLLNGRELDDTDSVSETQLRVSINRLHRKAQRATQSFYFVIDGLEELADDDSSARALVMSLLPLTLSRFRFLIAGNVHTLGIKEPAVAREVTLPFFGVNESIEFLKDLGLSRGQIEEIHGSCKGMPGYLGIVRARIKRGTDINELVQRLPQTLERLFELEWADRKPTDLQDRLLAFLAHERWRFTGEKLSAITGDTASDINRALGNVDFVVKDKEGAFQYRSESFRRFAAGKLVELRSAVHGQLIDYLLRDPTGDEALTMLPEQLREADRLDELVEFLSPENFATLLERASSVRDVQQKAEMGIAAARELGREGDLVRFTLQRSAIAEIVASDIGRDEIRSLAALGDYATALALAQGATRLEDRLQLLAAVARGLRENGMSIDADLTTQIQDLHRQIDYAHLGLERAEQIAGDLVHSHVDVAIDVLAKATESFGDNRVDWALAKLALRTAAHSSRNRSAGRETAQRLTERIGNPVTRRITQEAGLVVGGTTADEILVELERFEGPSDRLFLLRQWLLVNRTNADSHKVLDVAITMALQATGYAATATLFRELATPLPYIKDQSAARHFVSVFDSQLATIQTAGPTEDCVRLMLIMARTESMYDNAAVLPRLLDVYLYASTTADVEVRAVCMARILAALRRLDPAREFEKRDSLHSVVEADVRALTGAVLSGTADHFEAMKGIIGALSGSCPEDAFNIVARLNTEVRRDQGYAAIVDTLADIPLSDSQVGVVQRALNAIADVETRDDTTIDFLRRVCARRYAEGDASRLLPFLHRIKNLRDANGRMSAAAAGIIFATRHSSNAAGMLEELHKILLGAWEAIDAPWEKVDAGFAISAELAREAPEEARSLNAKSRVLKEQTDIADQGAAWAAIMSLRMAVRAFAGLLPKRLDTDAAFERLIAAIAIIPSPRAKAHLFADLAMRLQLAGRATELRRIGQQFLRPALEEFAAGDSEERARITIQVAPALYAAFPSSFEGDLQSLSNVERDRAFGQIVDFLLRRVSTFDPFEEHPGDGTLVDYETALEVCSILERMDADHTIYYDMADLIDAVLSSKSAITRLQQADIAKRLTDGVLAKLPNTRFIQHAGFRIAGQAQINRLRQRPEPAWERLIDEARAIDNLADRAYVLGIIASVGLKEAHRRSGILDEARAIIEQIPTLMDRVEHFQMFGNLMLGVDLNQSKGYFKTALVLSLAAKGEDAAEIRRRIVDTVSRVDHEYATALAAELNDDPARLRVQQHVKLLELKRKLTAQASEPFGKLETEEVARAAWMKLGALNSGRTDDVPMERIYPYLDYAARQPMGLAFPIFAWLIENAVRRYRNTNDAFRFIGPLFEAALLSAEMSIRASVRSSTEWARALKGMRFDDRSRLLLVKPGERNQAIGFLAAWLETHLGNYLNICDPYFTPDDIELLRMARRVNPKCHIRVLTSVKVHLERGLQPPFDQAYDEAWRRHSEDDAPNAEIIIAGIRGTSDSPIHDRWLVTEGAGLDMGTSFNGLGGAKVATMRVMDAEESAVKERELDQYVVLKASVSGGKRITYQIVPLGE